MMRYLAATAVFQEINLLNRYVTDVARERGVQAYVVRLQLSVVPTRRNMPYDVITDITIHGSDEQARAGLNFNGSNVCPARAPNDRVRIVPLLVTDNVESLAAARTEDQIRQLGLAMLATAGNIGLGGDVAATREALQRSAGAEINSLMTVARLSDDTVRVRLGAANSPRFGNVLVPRTHNISLLVLLQPCGDRPAGVESEYRELTAVTRAAFFDTETGEELPYEGYGDSLGTLFNRLNDKYPSTLTFEQFIKLYEAVSRQDRLGFETLTNQFAAEAGVCSPNSLQAMLVNVTRPYGMNAARACEFMPDRIRLTRAALWTDLIAARPSGEFSFANIPIEVRWPTPTPPDRAQTVVVSQSTTGATAQLLNGRDLPPSPYLSATLVIRTGETTGPNERVIRLASTEATVMPGGRAISLRFPPLSSIGVSGATPMIDAERFRSSIELSNLTMSVGATPQATPPFDSVHVMGVTVGAAKPPFTVTVSANAVLADPTGAGRVNLQFAPVRDAPAGRLRLAISGADLVSHEVLRGAGLTRDDAGWFITGAGEIRMTLANLTPGQTITFTTFVESEQRGDPVTRLVIAGAAPK